MVTPSNRASGRDVRPGATGKAGQPGRKLGFVDRWRHYLKWLRPGMSVKRWLATALLGICILVTGVDLMFLMQFSDLGDRLSNWMVETLGVSLAQESFIRSLTYQAIIGIPTVLLGLLVFLYGVYNVFASLTSVVAPEGDQAIVDVIWRRRQLAQGARVVVIGGGTGLSTLLRGLKEYTSNITAIVTVTDDGGSSGRLQREFNMLPPGDIRNCLVALADAEPLMQELFQYRFQEGRQTSELTGHSFGNILIAAMLHITGDFEEAVRQTSRVLAIRGRVLPSTTRHIRLIAELDDGSRVEGESRITAAGRRVERILLSDPEAEALDEALDAIRTADAIVIGPGSVYTSIVPNFLVRGVREAVLESKALKVYVCNVMTQPGETTDFTAADHVRALQRHTARQLFDHVLVNVREPGEDARTRYASVGSTWVLPDVEEIKRLGLRPIAGDLISETSIVRHDHEKLARTLIELINRNGRSPFWAFDYRGWW